MGTGQRVRHVSGKWTLGRLAAEHGDEIVQLNDEMQRVAGGPFTTERGAHPKGVFGSGTFVASGALADLTQVSHLREGTTPVTVRVSNYQRPLDQIDVKGLAVKFHPDGRPDADMIAMTAKVFIVDSIQGFRDLGELTLTPKRRVLRQLQLGARLALGGLSGPAAIDLRRQQRAFPFYGRGPDHLASRYFGVHTFVFDDGAVPFKFRWEPVAGNPALSKAAGDAHFDLMIDLFDPTWKHRNRPTKAPRRRHLVQDPITAGRLTIDTWGLDGLDHVIFNPIRLPAGISPGDDEILFARAAAYPVSHLRRTTDTTAGDG